MTSSSGMLSSRATAPQGASTAAMESVSVPSLKKAGRAAYRSKRAALALKVEVFMADILVVLKRFD
jgi:hypothetical protein